MAKGNYDLENPAPRRKDTSFTSLICAMLIFIALCVLIVIAMSVWSKNRDVSRHLPYYILCYVYALLHQFSLDRYKRIL